MSYSTVKRFIAGAVCPRCAAPDTVRAYSEGGSNHRECVACGFTDQQCLGVGVSVPDTRVDKSQRKAKASIEPLKFIDNKVD